MKNTRSYQSLSEPRPPFGLQSSSAAVALILAGSFLSSSQVDAAVVALINDDFSSGSLSGNARIRTGQGDGTFYTDNSPATAWTIADGVLSNAGTELTGQTEGAISQVVNTSGLASDLTSLTLSFDYVVGATATLKFALVGYTENLQDGVTGADATSTVLMNNGTTNGSLQNNSQGELRHGDINLLTGADMTQNITNDLTFGSGTSGSHSVTFDLTSYAWHADEAAATNTPGLSGSITSIADFDYIVLVAVNDLSSTVGVTATTLDNIMLTVVPEPSATALFGLGSLALLLRRRR